MCGPSGCGKSTFIKNNRHDLFYNCAIVSRDEIRFHLLSHNDKYFAKEKFVITKFAATIGAELRVRDVVADATHLTPKTRAFILNKIKATNPLTDVRVFAIYFDKEDCKQRCFIQNEQREEKLQVPALKIAEMIERYVHPSVSEGFDNVFRIYITEDNQTSLCKENKS